MHLFFVNLVFFSAVIPIGLGVQKQNFQTTGTGFLTLLFPAA